MEDDKHSDEKRNETKDGEKSITEQEDNTDLYLKIVLILILLAIGVYLIYLYVKPRKETFMNFFEQIPMYTLHMKPKPQVKPTPTPSISSGSSFYDTSSIRSQYLPKLSVAFS